MSQIVISNLKNKYFNNPDKIIELKKGDVLIEEGKENRQLFLVLDGLLLGILNRGTDNEIEVFRSEKDMLVGVHSFFSRCFFAYADVVAKENTKLAYLSYEDEIVRPDAFLDDFLPVIIDKLFERQVFAQKLMIEKENALIENLHRDKLATLGQMAAGIAHELNNAIGVIKGNSEWAAKEIHRYIETNELPKVFSIFDKGYEKGQYLSSSEVRKKRQLAEKKLNLSSSSAKKLAKLDLSDAEIKQLSSEKDVDAITNRVYNFWEMGVAIHDILLASKHASNVITSVKSLGISEREQLSININRTLKEALTLVQEQSEGIAIEFHTEELPIIQANDTELIQVWVNLIKNACESLKHANTENPKITIKTENKDSVIIVSITDNGPGIPDNVKGKIFQPDFTTKKGGLSFGLGLGLPVVQKHINHYKGTIEINSKPGETTFLIKLPIK